MTRSGLLAQEPFPRRVELDLAVFVANCEPSYVGRTAVEPVDRKRKSSPAAKRGRRWPGRSARHRARNADDGGFRPNVAMVIHNNAGQVLWARRIGGGDQWQFPQGGVHRGETAQQALFRELREEVGLEPDAVEVIAYTRDWFRYRVPASRRRPKSHFVGQKQRWFLLRLLAADEAVRVHGPHAEFDAWRWVSYWYPVGKVVDFKRAVYRRALKELAPLMHTD